MMKKIILAIGFMFGAAVFVNAQEQQDTTSTQSTQQSDQYRNDQYRTDTTSVDDNQHQEVIPEDDAQSEQSDMYRTEGEGDVNDSTATDGSSTTTGAESTTDSESSMSEPTNTDSEATNQTQTTTETESTTGQSTNDNQMYNDQGGLSQDQEEGERVEVSELPAAVQAKLQSTDYQGWVVTSARKKMWSESDNAQAGNTQTETGNTQAETDNTQAGSKEIYIIEAKNGSETKKLKFDKDGNEIKHDKHGKHDKYKKDDQK